jgi:hypothetical protein
MIELFITTAARAAIVEAKKFLIRVMVQKTQTSAVAKLYCWRTSEISVLLRGQELLDFNLGQIDGLPRL